MEAPAAAQLTLSPGPQVLGAISADDAEAPAEQASLQSRRFPAAEPIQRQALALLCMVTFIEGADMQLLPATFRALEVDLGLSPAALASMLLAQSLFMSTTSPLWGGLADRWPRKGLLVFSCSAWGVLTLLLAMVQSTKTMLGLRCLHGAALSALGPISQSVVADISKPEARGLAYGWLYGATCVGMIVASLLGTVLGSRTLAYGVKGWRAAFIMIAGISMLAAALLQYLMVEPAREGVRKQGLVETESPASGCRAGVRMCRVELRRSSALLRIRTFTVIAAQGMFGCVPWNALGFLTMYLQLSGHNDTAAALIVSGKLLGKSVGGLLGGLLGDTLAARSPDYGRPCTALISVLLGIPFAASLVILAPHASARLLMANAVVLGFVASWCSTGVNRPILTEIVTPTDRASIVAWLYALEGSSGALFGAPVVGLLAERVFGYRNVHRVTRQSHTGSEAPDFLTTAMPHPALLSQDTESWHVIQKQNAFALSRAILWGTVPPWLLCALFYCILFYTLRRDVKVARNAYALVDKEQAKNADGLKG